MTCLLNTLFQIWQKFSSRQGRRRDKLKSYAICSWDTWLRDRVPVGVLSSVIMAFVLMSV